MALVEIYEKPLCPYCRRAKELLTRKKVGFLAIDVSRNDKRRDEMIQRAGGRYTVPQIFVDGTHVGGCNDLHALERAGRLDAMLTGSSADAPRQSEEGARFVASENDGRRRPSRRVAGLSRLLTRLASVCFR